MNKEFCTINKKATPDCYFAEMISLHNIRDKREWGFYKRIKNSTNILEIKSLIEKLAIYEEDSAKIPFRTKAKGSKTMVSLSESLGMTFDDSDVFMVFNHNAHRFVVLDEDIEMQMEAILHAPPKADSSKKYIEEYIDFVEIKSLIERACIAYTTRIVKAGCIHNGKPYLFDAAPSDGLKKANCYMIRADMRRQRSKARWCRSSLGEMMS